MRFVTPFNLCAASVALSTCLAAGPAHSAPKRRPATRKVQTPKMARPRVVAARKKSLSFADFDRRARAGEHLNVVFFGASLTWGANASNPLKTSYRALTGQRLEKLYPNAHLKFHDAAIGGTSSQLGVFRLDRDVLPYKPDLVFLDFSANDDIESIDVQRLSSYEALVRRILAEAKAPIVQVIFPFKWNVQFGDLAKMKRRLAHLDIARHYNLVSGDAISAAKDRIAAKQTTLDALWPLDGSHPGDKGYQLFADVAMQAYRQGVASKVTCRVPAAMLNTRTYLQSARVRLSSLGSPVTGAMPQGWHVGQPNRTSEWFDMLMSRWLDDETIASNRHEIVGADGKTTIQPQAVEPFRARFVGSMLMLLGESTTKSCKYRVRIDGQVVEYTPWNSKTPLQEYDAASLAKIATGNAHHVQLIREDLAPGVVHTVEIEPVFSTDTEQELRLESICVAGEGARVWPAG